jgi:K+/H+ antiporter YhaU regulatory subunit KhtT
VVALRVNGVLSINPDPNVAIGENAELILMGSLEGERKFLRVFGV